MSAKQMGMVWDFEFDRAEQSIMLALADHADHEGGNIYPSMGRVAWKTGYSRRHVIRIVRKLRERGILVLVQDANPGKHRAAEYRIDWAKAEPKQPYGGGDTTSPGTGPSDTGDTTPSDTGDTTPSDTGVTGASDIAMSHEPSLEPSLEPSESDTRTRAPEPDMNPSLPGANIDDYDDELDEMKTVLGQVVKENLFYGPHEQRIREGAKALLQAGHTPEQVATGFGDGDTYWYVASHGSKGEKPWVKNVVGEIVTAVAWVNGEIKGLDNTEQAWAIVERAFQLSDGRILKDHPKVLATVNALGGWGQVKKSTDRDIPFVKQRFAKEYANVRV